MQSTDAVIEAAEERMKEVRKRGGIAPTKKKCIAVLTPTLGKVSMWWHTSMVDIMWPMNCGKAYIPTQDVKGDEIGEMRNRLVSMALLFEQTQDLDLESVMWVDDDVIISRLALLTLCAHDVDIASGVYFAKGDPSNDPLIFDGPGSGTVKWKPDEVAERWGWAQGLCLVKTEVYKRMRDDLELPKDKYGNPSWYKRPDFGVEPNGQITLGGTEDFYFFDNASKLGYRPLVDCTKHAFGWHFDMDGRHGPKLTGYPRKQWEQYVRREPIVWQTKEGEVIWD